MNVVDVSRWQFGFTTIHHFIFVPLTIGLAPLIAVIAAGPATAQLRRCR